MADRRNFTNQFGVYVPTETAALFGKRHEVSVLREQDIIAMDAPAENRRKSADTTRAQAETLSEKIIRLRKRAGLTQGELAKLTGVGIATITRYEKGYTTNPRHSVLTALANAFYGCKDPQMLLEGTEFDAKFEAETTVLEKVAVPASTAQIDWYKGQIDLLEKVKADIDCVIASIQYDIDRLQQEA